MDQRTQKRPLSLAAAKSLPHRAWAHDLVRLPVLTVYYLPIIVALVIMYGGTTYTPPPFIYQGF